MTLSERHLGVYGIYTKEDQLLVVDKLKGPYKYRYDLPGGGLEDKESIVQGLHRELLEEVGASFSIKENVGTYDFFVSYCKNQEPFTLHHIAIMFTVEPTSNLEIHTKTSSDTKGYLYVPLGNLTLDNSSPLALKAKALVRREPTDISEYLSNWKPLSSHLTKL